MLIFSQNLSVLNLQQSLFNHLSPVLLPFSPLLLPPSPGSEYEGKISDQYFQIRAGYSPKGGKKAHAHILFHTILRLHGTHVKSPSTKPMM